MLNDSCSSVSKPVQKIPSIPNFSAILLRLLPLELLLTLARGSILFMIIDLHCHNLLPTVASKGIIEEQVSLQSASR